MQDNVVSRVVGIFMVIAAVLVVVAVVAVRNIRRSIASNEWVNHTHAVILEADATVTALHAAEAALRDYLLTGDARDQAAYRGAYNEMLEHLAVAKGLTRSESVQYKQLLQLEVLLGKRVDVARAAVQARQDRPEALREVVATSAPSLQEIRRQVQKFKEEQKVLLRERDRDSYLQAQTTRWTVLAGVGLNFVLLGFAAWLVRDDIAARRRAGMALAEANAQLEQKVSERTAELAQANQKLKEENLERRWANQALQHQLHYNQLIINSIGDLIFLISKALNITRVNPAAAHATGMAPEEIIGLPITRVLRVTGEGLPGAALGQDPILLAMKEDRVIQDRPVTVVSKAGHSTEARFSFVPLHDQDRVVGGVVTVRAGEGRAPGNG